MLHQCDVATSVDIEAQLGKGHEVRLAAVGINKSSIVMMSNERRNQATNISWSVRDLSIL